MRGRGGLRETSLRGSHREDVFDKKGPPTPSLSLLLYYYYNYTLSSLFRAGSRDQWHLISLLPV